MNTLGKTAPLAAALLALAACGGGGGSDSGSTSTSSSSGGQTGSSVDVTPCLTQQVTSTRTVTNLVVPDVLQLNLAAAQGFPNGRRLNDPVVDVILAAVFLDLKVHGADTFAKIPLNPSGPDVPQPAGFPYLAPAQGGTPAVTGGSGFVFRTDAPSAYTRVDRMGFPAVATALVSSANKTPFNDDTPAIDATGKWAPEFKATLTTLATALADDLRGLNLTGCAKVS
ncbi:DUF4331 family protein [Sphingomonas solaris]|uniref:DUF4331 domain-containing protein n=1 Tax=Alterirhizorhabdus solaris TaxID=2529389 RepID=A0A558R0F1_9SPHN|nr:DUF4331 family protein [Sphingomonas solaris]TVV72865.1 DUF4331 domain-containing protein [Sphingomonas solaris]